MHDQQNLSPQSLERFIACPECDLLLQRPTLGAEQKACCPRCNCVLGVNRSHMRSRALALVICALLLYIPANFLPIMRLELYGNSSVDTIWDSTQGLYRSGMPEVALIVFMCSMLVPLVKLLSQLFVLLSLHQQRLKPAARHLYKTYWRLREWGMLEVYLFGILVSIVKLKDLAHLHVGMGLVCFIALILVQVWLEVTMSPQQVWQRLNEEDTDART